MKKGDYITCPHCKGRGKVYDREDAVFTLGISMLFGRDKKCPRCGGSGFVEVR